MIHVTHTIAIITWAWLLQMAWRLIDARASATIEMGPVGVCQQSPTWSLTTVGSAQWCLRLLDGPLVAPNWRLVLAIYTCSHTRRHVGSGTDLTHRPGQNGRYFTENILKCIFTNKKFFIRISLKFIPNKPGWLLVMAWCRTGSQPLPEPMLIPCPGFRPQAYICDTRRNDSARPLHKHIVALTQLLHNHWSLRERYTDTGHRFVSLSVLKHNLLTFEFHVYSGLNTNIWHMLWHTARI